MSLQSPSGAKAEEGPSEITWVDKSSLLRGPRKEASWVFSTAQLAWSQVLGCENQEWKVQRGGKPEVLVCALPITQDTGVSRKA